jgi:glutathione S-transferase
MLHEILGDDFEVKRVELYEGAQYEAGYLVLNPNHSVPVLEIHWEDGSIQHMLESVAMVEWLADHYSERELCPHPGSGARRADYMQIMYFAGAWLDMMLWQIRIHTHILGEDEADQKTLDRYRGKFIDDGEPQILARLNKHEYILDDQFSAADCIMGHIVFWAKAYGLCQGERFDAYLATLMQRDSLAKSLDDLATFQIAPEKNQPIIEHFNG